MCTIGGFLLACQSWLPVTFKIGNRSTKQALYICSEIQVIYFNKAACIIDIGILPPWFPKSMTSLPSATCNAIHHKIDPPANKTNFNNPKTPPYLPTSENIQKLKEWLLDQFATTVFNNSGKFPAMSGPPAHIHLKEGATPKAKHNLIPVPYHYKEEVKTALWVNVKRGIIAPVPIGTPSDWGSTMVITAKRETKENGGLPTSKIPVQTGNTPHQLVILTVNTSTTKRKKNSPRCHGWLPFNPSK